jgi:hypothetical protein
MTVDAPAGETPGERLTALEQWVKGHEQLCAERYGDLRENMRWLVRGVFGLLVGVVAWLGVQLWAGAQARVDALERAAAAAAAAPHGP